MTSLEYAFAKVQAKSSIEFDNEIFLLNIRRGFIYFRRRIPRRKPTYFDFFLHRNQYRIEFLWRNEQRILSNLMSIRRRNCSRNFFVFQFVSQYAEIDVESNEISIQTFSDCSNFRHGFRRSEQRIRDRIFLLGMFNL